MSERDFNRGMDAAFFGEEPTSRHPDYIEGYCYGESARGPQYPEPEPPAPTLEEMCDPHPYYGDDLSAGCGRCYCGAVQYSIGGDCNEERE